MPRVQLKINGASVADWLADTSTKFPNAEFTVLMARPTDDGLLGIVEVTVSDGDTLVRHFDNASEVRSYEVIDSDEQLVLIQFLIPVSESYDALLASGNLPHYPVLLREGWFSTEVTATQERLSAYTEELAAADIPYRVVSLTQSHDSSELLTDRQWELITEALEHGYYDIPRNCTLTDLAATLDVNISAVSRLRHRAESRIISDFVARSTP